MAAAGVCRSQAQARQTHSCQAVAPEIVVGTANTSTSAATTGRSSCVRERSDIKNGDLARLKQDSYKSRAPGLECREIQAILGFLAGCTPIRLLSPRTRRLSAACAFPIVLVSIPNDVDMPIHPTPAFQTFALGQTARQQRLITGRLAFSRRLLSRPNHLDTPIQPAPASRTFSPGEDRPTSTP